MKLIRNTALNSDLLSGYWQMCHRWSWGWGWGGAEGRLNGAPPYPCAVLMALQFSRFDVLNQTVDQGSVV